MQEGSEQQGKLGKKEGLKNDSKEVGENGWQDREEN